MMAAIVAIEPAMAGSLTQEDGLIENLTMSLFGSAAVVCAVFAFGTRGPLRAYFVLWAALSLIFFGEEVSWGQRWIGFDTPAVLSGNYQQEANIHNLPWLTPRVVEGPADLMTSQGLFYVGFFAYFFAIPAGVWAFRPMRRLAQRMRFPPMPWALLAAIWLPVIASFILASLIAFGPSREALTETRELHFALSILLYALLLVASAAPSAPLPQSRHPWA